MDATSHLTAALSGRYVVEREIGAGGMATVYLARDVRHDRQVALKVLNPELGAVLGVERFLAEIKVTANLQHPNLLPLFDSGAVDGLLFYVMPFVDGESLRARLDREKQLPLDDALRIATAIASALDYAHRRGVIHRDLKPENILLREGQPLLADFGIALAVSNAGGARITQTGLSLGTPQYMSPEQATGDRSIDGRTDIYSLAAVLYEMLTGDPPHTASTAQAIIAKVLTERPRNVRASRPVVSANVAAAIDRALEKLPADRFATAHDFGEALRTNTVPALDHTAAPQVSVSVNLSTARVATGVGAAAVIAVAAWGWLRPPVRVSPEPTRFAVTLPRDVSVDNQFSPLAVSHDGRTVILRVASPEGVHLVRRLVGQLDVQSIPGTDRAASPAMSPDGKWVVFAADDQLRKVPIDGGPAVPIAPTEGNITGVDWSPNGTLVIGSGPVVKVLRVVPATGGAPKRLTTIDTAAGEISHVWPRLLSDGNTVVYVSWLVKTGAAPELSVTTLSSGTSKRLGITGTAPLGVVDGQLIYVTLDGVLMAVPFDVKGQRVTGTPVALMEGISMNRVLISARAALSDSGTFVYLSGGSAMQLVATDLTGVSQTLMDRAADFRSPAWSPDGRRIALVQATAQGGDIVVFDFGSNAFSRVTTGGSKTSPTWTPDGKYLLFTSLGEKNGGLWRQPADGSTPPEKVFEPKNGLLEALMAPDEHTLIFRAFPRNRLFSVDLAGDRTPTLIADEGHLQAHPALSPDGKWLAYATDEGEATQVVVRPFPGPGGQTQVSTDGGIEPVWSHDGKQLFYRHGRQVVAVDMSSGASLHVGARRVLFEGPYQLIGLMARPGMSVSPDGKRLAMLRPVDDGLRVVVTTNWLTELRTRLSAKSR